MAERKLIYSSDANRVAVERRKLDADIAVAGERFLAASRGRQRVLEIKWLRLLLQGDRYDSIKITRYRWFAGGRSSKRYRKCDVFDVSIGLRANGADSGELLENELARPQSLDYRRVAK